MTDTKPVLTPRVGQEVICEGYDGSGGWISPESGAHPVMSRENSTVWIKTPAGQHRIGLRSIVEIVKPAQEEKPKMHSAPAGDAAIIAMRAFSQARLQISTEEEERQAAMKILCLIARIEADREKRVSYLETFGQLIYIIEPHDVFHGDTQAMMDLAIQRTKERVDQLGKLQAQNAEQAQEIADLRGCVYARQEEIARLKVDRPSWTASCAGAGVGGHQRVWYDEPGCPVCAGAIFSDRRKGERRVPYCRFDCCRKVTDRRRLGHDRRKAK